MSGVSIYVLKVLNVATQIMRVLLVSFIDDNKWSGMGKWTHHMAEGLEDLGHEVSLWFANDFPLLRRTGRLAVLLFPIVLAFQLARFRSRFDVVVIHEPCGFWYGVLRWSFSSLPPFIAMCHNVESKHFEELLEAANKGLAQAPLGMRIKTPLFRRWQSNCAVKLADHIICLSNADRDYLMNRLGRRPEQITILVNGVSSEYFFNRQTHKAKQRALFVGGWLDVKGRRLLPAIWSDVHTKFPDATLTLIGTGCSAEDVKRDFKVNARNSITVIPRLDSEKDMAAQYATHDLFLMPSLSEGSPLALFEAMAAAVPVVATSVGGIKDVVIDGSNGLLFDPASPADGATKVNLLLGNPSFASRIGIAGQEHVRSLSWRMAAETLDKALQLTMTQVNLKTNSLDID